MTTPVLSVIICAYNRPRELRLLLQSLREQTLDPSLWEAIVVDNRSTDETPHVAASFVGARPDIRYVREDIQGHSRARNRGYRESRGSYLVYLDDDVLLAPEYLSNVLEVVRQHRPDIAGGPVFPYYPHGRPRWFRDAYETRQYETESRFSRTCRITGCNFIIRKDVLERLGLFDPEMGLQGPGQIGLGDDALVLDTYRTVTSADAQRVYYALECGVRHAILPAKMTVDYLFRRQYVSGRASIRALAKRQRITGRDVARPAAASLYRAMRGLWGEVRAGSPRRVDVLNFLRHGFFALGLVVEGMREAVRPRHVR